MFLPFTADDLEEAVRNGDVTKRDHPNLPYHIYNYSPEIQYSNKWNSVTLACRGLILDEDYNIVARPWEKFFNLGQVNLPIQFDTPVEVMDKADGSLGIMYPDPKGNNYIATRGSFTSEQAAKATAMLWDKYPRIAHNDADWNDIYTFLFEIVYPENRIVLDYGGMEDLILLGAVDNQNGYYYSPQFAKSVLEWTGPVVETYDYNTISDALGQMGRKNKEGYVIRSHNFMVKVKEPDYIDLHRLVTNASPKTVWEQLRAGKTKTQIISAFPDEFHAYIESMIDPLIVAFGDRQVDICNQYYNIISEVPAFSTRKDYAKAFSKFPDKRYFFLIHDGKNIKDVLWTELKPKEKVVV
jgi:RNA ligase